MRESSVRDDGDEDLETDAGVALAFLSHREIVTTGTSTPECARRHEARARAPLRVLIGLVGVALRLQLRWNALLL